MEKIIYNLSNCDKIQHFIGSTLKSDFYGTSDKMPKLTMSIPVENGFIDVSYGDWIEKHDNGDFFVVRSKGFLKFKIKL